jgi:hypothetical protein
MHWSDFWGALQAILVIAAVVIGSALGGITATDHIGGAWKALGSFFAWAASSLFFSVGIIAFPAAFLFAVVFIRSEWPLWTVAIVALLIWWNSHKTIYYLFNESAGAKVPKQMDAMIDDINKRQQQQPKSQRTRTQRRRSMRCRRTRSRS